MGRNPDSQVKKEILAEVPSKVVEALVPMAEAREGIPTDPTGIHAKTQLTQSGVKDAVAWLTFCGLSARAIAKKLNLAVSTTQKYVKTPEFIQYYENNKTSLLAKVHNAVQDRFQETLLWAVNEKIRLAKSTRNMNLKNKILTELIELGLDTFKSSQASFSDELTTIWERQRRRRDEDGNVVTEKVTITGPTAPHDAERGRQEAWVDAGPSAPSGENGASEG